MFLFKLRSLIRTRLSVAGYSPSRVFLCGCRTIFLRSSQRVPQSLLKPFLSQKTWKAGIFVSPSPDDLSKQKHPCWGAISFSFIKKRSKHPEVCPSGKGNSPCRRLASGRTLCGEFANRACCRKRPTWMASPKQKHPCWGAFVLEAPPGIGPGIKVLQTSALPLGYGALSRIQKNVCFIYKKNERGVHSFF